MSTSGLFAKTIPAQEYRLRGCTQPPTHDGMIARRPRRLLFSLALPLALSACQEDLDSDDTLLLGTADDDDDDDDDDSSNDDSPWVPDEPQAMMAGARLKPAIDTNPHPRIFETTFVTSERQMKVRGERVSVFAYNGRVPGPLISVKEGDRVIVHLKNKLPEGWDTTIHWHGIEGNNAADGTPVTQ